MFGWWHRALVTHITSWIDGGDLSFNNCKYSRIMAIDSNGKSLVNIFPDFKVISEKNLHVKN